MNNKPEKISPFIWLAGILILWKAQDLVYIVDDYIYELEMSGFSIALGLFTLLGYILLAINYKILRKAESKFSKYMLIITTALAIIPVGFSVIVMLFWFSY